MKHIMKEEVTEKLLHWYKHGTFHTFMICKVYWFEFHNRCSSNIFM